MYSPPKIQLQRMVRFIAAATRLLRRRGSTFILIFLLVCHAVLLAWSAKLHSPTLYETGHIPAGLSHWQFRLFELYRVNPPLPRMVATLPLLLEGTKTDWTNYSLSPLGRETIPMGIRFVNVNGSRTFHLFALARWACVPFSLLGAYICYRWAFELWGGASAWTAVFLWCFNPFILGHGSLAMPDVPATALGLSASYLFWCWLRQPTWFRAIGTGIVLGAANLSKTTLLIFFIIWPMLWLLSIITQHGCNKVRLCLAQFGMISTTACLSIYTINLGYAFTGTGEKLGEFQFESKLLAGKQHDQRIAGNRFSDSWLGNLRVPLPRDYIQGIDRQRADFEEGGRSYLRGNWREHGWWYYHIYGLLIKLPLGTWLLIFLATFYSWFSALYRAKLIDELCLLLPTIAIVFLVSSQYGFSNHVRYCIPALPFTFIWMSKVSRAFSLQNCCLASCVVVGVFWSTVSSLIVYPHNLSYFNELVCGPANGHNHLLDSNISCGQDLLLLRRWMDEHPQADPLGLACVGWVHPSLTGIRFRLPPVGPRVPIDKIRGNAPQIAGPVPGWYAIDVNYLHGTEWPTADGNGKWVRISTDDFNYEYFLRFSPVARIGYSIYIYHLTHHDVDTVRRDLGLPPYTNGL